jgi:SanA protein
MKQLFQWLLYTLLVTLLLLVGWSHFIAYQTQNLIYKEVDALPTQKVALVLGTAKYRVGGGKNYFYTYRINATVALWRAGKIKSIIVSGDHQSKYYDETTTMFNDLVNAGIPPQYITKDSLGLRTLDSIVRAKEVFHTDEYIVISQKFHLERALYIAKEKQHNAIGYVAKDIPYTPTALKMQLREYLARAKAFLDLYILDTQPKFLKKV